MTGDPNSNLNAVEARMAALRMDLEAALASATRRTTTMRVVLIIIILAMIGYFTFIYKQLATVDAELVAGYAEAKINERLEDGAAQLTANIKNRAPELIAELEERAMSAPQLLSRQLRQLLLVKIDEAAPQLEQDVVEGLTAVIDQVAIHGDHASGPVDEEQFTAFQIQVADEYFKQISELIKQAHQTYVDGSAPIWGYLERLATAEDLSARERHHRDLVVSTLSVLEKYSSEQTPGTGLFTSQ